jgi:sugar/nucleoside kinase (ribokinase family)
MALGLFIGMTTLDLVYLTAYLPQPNQKMVALDSAMAAGGPATNAAVTFRWLGNQSRLVSALGQHPSTAMIHTDLAGIELWDLTPERLESPPISSILVTEATGDRAVVAINATKFQAKAFSASEVQRVLQQVDIVLIDGHQIAVSAAIAAEARRRGIVVVLDGGSWKPGLETILPWVDYAICSANFYPPGCETQEQVFAYLGNLGVPAVAITQGRDAILYACDGDGCGDGDGDRPSSGRMSGSISPPQVQTVDTLGAGDIFHGAFCHFILTSASPTEQSAASDQGIKSKHFAKALAQAAQVAAQSCQHFGPRTWMDSAVVE